MASFAFCIQIYMVTKCGHKSDIPAEAVLDSASHTYLADLANCGFNSISHPVTLRFILRCLLQGKRIKLCCHSPARLLWCTSQAYLDVAGILSQRTLTYATGRSKCLKTEQAALGGKSSK